MKNLLTFFLCIVFCFSLTGNLHAVNTAGEDELLDLTIAESVMAKIRADKLVYTKSSLEANVDEYLEMMDLNGSFGGSIGIDHLYKLKEMAVAYTEPGNKHYESIIVYNKTVRGLKYWYNNWHNHSNWWYNWIAYPRELGLTLIALYPGEIKFTEDELFQQITDRWKEKGGRPDYNGAQAEGANKVDIATHWIYRSCLTRNKADFEFSVNEGSKVAAFTTGEGIQHDFSMRQHGAQLYVGGYGTELAQLTVRMAYYLAGTPYALSGEKLEVLTGFIRNTYLPVIRGRRMSYNAMGRQLSRANYTSRTSDMSFIKMLTDIDPANAAEYEAAYKRIGKTEDPSFGLQSFQTHYYRGEYTLQQRPGYNFDIRMISKRMARSEYDKDESRKSYFISDGATSIMVDGEEYGSIIPLFDWTKMPGTTLPAFTVKPDPLTSQPLPTTLRRAGSYIANGRSNYAGGVTDGLYGVSAFDMVNDQSLYAYNDPNGTYGLLPALDFGAKKSWFIFDNEIVCLGAGIRSAHEGLNVYTTVNQCHKPGTVTVSNSGAEFEQAIRTQNYTSLDWVLNDKVAYFFPEKGDVYVSNETRTGSWRDVNTSGTTDAITDDVFTLYFDHGVEPVDATYAYVIVPNITTAAEARDYEISNIEILTNTDSVQAVYHKELKMYGFAFYKPGYFKTNDIEVDVDAGCVLLIKDVDQSEATVYVADPQKSGTSINIGIRIPNVAGMKGLVYPKIESPHTGKTLEFKVNESTSAYEGREVHTLLDRGNWTITCSIEAPSDATVKGNDPTYIIDGDNVSAYLFVKPGKSYGGVSAPADYIPSFTIDMQSPQEFNSFIYRHRTEGNTLAMLRASKISFYAKNNEGEEFTPIMPNHSIATDIDEIRVSLPDMVNYRYVKVTMDDWDKENGSTMQVSEFNLSKTTRIGGNSKLKENDFISGQLLLYPNPVSKGGIVKISTVVERECVVDVKDLYGKTVYINSESLINTSNLVPNVYIVILKDKNSGEIIGNSKLVVK